MRARVPLSVLDLAIVGQGQTSGQALADSTRVAVAAEGLGYRRFWVAEHHNMPAVASTSPAVLIAHVAGATERIRVGSGGVMLPNHAPFAVAEQFALLEALHPGRVDLGIGRAPGTDPRTAAALRRTVDGLGAEDFPDELLTLLQALGHPAARAAAPTWLQATPAPTSSPEVVLLGSSGYSAELAGLLGLPFAYAHHFSTGLTLPAVELYRSVFRPSAALAEPYVIVTAGVIAAPSQEEADAEAAPSHMLRLSLRTGELRPLMTPEEAAADPRLPAALAIPSTAIVGPPDQAARELDALAAATGAGELMISTVTHGVDARLRSLELLMAAWSARAPGSPETSPP